MIITLCGSTKFQEEFEKMNRKWTLNGHVVFSCGVFGHTEGIKFNMNTKLLLDDVHKRKIDMSDAIFVINKNGYIGSSTQSEIDYARELGKTIYFLEWPDSYE